MPLPFKPPRLTGISTEQIEALYEEKYGVEVRRFNKADKKLQSARNREDASSRKSRQQLLHCVTRFEHHFSSLGESPGQPHEKLEAAIRSDFKSYENWHSSLISMLPADSDKRGWLTLMWCAEEKTLKNLWLEFEADQSGSLVPIIVICLHEKAYKMDFGEDVTGYVKAYLDNVDWAMAEQRLVSAINGDKYSTDETHATDKISAESLTALVKSDSAPLVLDVRLAEDIRPEDTRISGSSWLDPTKVSNWGKEFPPDQPLVVYCMYGYWVSQDTAEALIKLGINAKYLGGGISAWRALGSAVEPVG